ncbi:MAG: PQQ-binding-like beta-propeller repeat protein [bacterium]
MDVMSCHGILKLVLKSLITAAKAFLAIWVLSTQASQAQTFEIEFDSTSYLQVEPFQRSTLVWATVRNTGTQVEQIIFEVQVVPAEGWHFHSLRYLYLEPGEGERPLAFDVQHVGGRAQTITANFHIFAMRDTSSSVDISIDVTHVGLLTPEFTFPIRVGVYDENTGVPLTNAHVYIWAGSRPEQARLMGSGLYEKMVVPYDTLRSLAQQYNISWGGYSLEVHCAGYQSYYEDAIVPPEGSNEIYRDISLTPLDVTVNFQPSWYSPLDYPGVWEIVPSADWSYLAVGMGKHPDPWDVHPILTEVHLFDLAGTLLWSYPVNEEVWGIDITSDGSLVAAGTSGGMLHVIDRMGNLVWQHEHPSEHQIREVKFSHNGHYLCYEASPFKLYDAATGDTLWEFPFIDVHWRGITFSHDDAYIAYGGGSSLLLLDINGNFIWEKYIGGVLPYFIGITPDLSRIVVADKGDLLSCFDGSGNLLWRHYMNVLTDAHMSTDGSRIVTLSHDGIIRMYDRDGNLLWHRAVDGAGHNGLHMTGDGKYIVVGGGTVDSPYKTMLLDEDGNLLWEHSQPGPIPDPYHPYLISTMNVVISPDAKFIVSGYGAGAPGIQLFQGEIATSVREEISDNTILSDAYELSQNIPNPFNSTTLIEYVLPEDGPVKIEVYNILGQKIATLVNEVQPAGVYSVAWHGMDDRGRNVASGIYLHKLETRDFVKVRKTLLLR